MKFLVFALFLPTGLASFLSPPPPKHLHLERQIVLIHPSGYSKIRYSSRVSSTRPGLNMKEGVRAKFYFNRQEVTETLTRHLNKDPVFTVIVGPPSCGKSTLINNVLDQREGGKNSFHVIRVDLRGCDVSDKNKLYSILLRKSSFAASVDQMWSAFSEILKSLENSGKLKSNCTAESQIC